MWKKRRGENIKGTEEERINGKRKRKGEKEIKKKEMVKSRRVRCKEKERKKS